MTPSNPPPSSAQVLHEELRNILQQFANDYGLRVTGLSVNWLTIYEQASPRSMIDTLSVTIESIAP